MKRAVLILLFFASFLKGFSFFEGDSINNDSIIRYAKKFLGTKYIYAANDPRKGFDCSGFTWYVYGNFKLKVPRSSRAYETFGVTVPKDSARKGDVIVFTGTDHRIRRAGHVGIVVSDPGEDLRFIHCSSRKKKGGVIISSFRESSYYEKRFIRICRVPAS